MGCFIFVPEIFWDSNPTKGFEPPQKGGITPVAAGDFARSASANTSSPPYVARQEKLQYISSYGLVVGLLNKGTWPGSLYSWGSSRIALEASKETNTFDRGGFYIHGGWEPGSNGCIDLTSQMDDFTKWFENNGHDLIINIKYQR